MSSSGQFGRDYEREIAHMTTFSQHIKALNSTDSLVFSRDAAATLQILVIL